MQARTYLPVSLIALLLIIMSGCRSKADAPFSDRVMGGRGQVGDLLVSGGNVMVHEDQPGVFFGTVKTPGSTEHLSYLIVFKHGKPQTKGTSLSQSGDCSCTGNKGSADYTVIVNGKTLQAKHEIQLDDMGKVASEVLEVGGKVVDVKAGRLFLIDLTAASPTYEQRDIELSTSIPVIESPKDVGAVATQTLEVLKSEIPDEFAN